MKKFIPAFIIVFFITLFITAIIILPKGTEYEKHLYQLEQIKNYQKTFK